MTDVICQEPWHSEKIDCLAVALCKAQAGMAPAIRDAKNPHLGNKYADLASVWDACRKPLTDNGLAVVQLPRCENGTVYVRTMLIHASGQWVSCEMGVELADTKGITPAQAVGSIVTYLRRYTLSAIVGVAPDDDTDGNAPGVKPAQQYPRTTVNAPGRAGNAQVAQTPVSSAESAPAPPVAPATGSLPEGIESWEGHKCAHPACGLTLAASVAVACHNHGVWPPACRRHAQEVKKIQAAQKQEPEDYEPGAEG